MCKNTIDVKRVEFALKIIDCNEARCCFSRRRPIWKGDKY